MTDWQANLESIHAAARSSGYGDLTSLLRAMPCASYAELVDILGDQFAPIQLIAASYLEARSNGKVREAAMDALCRNIIERVPLGWGVGDNARQRAVSALAGWGSELMVTGGFPHLESIIHRIQDSLAPPEGWKPNGHLDPVIVDAFNRCWPADVS